MTHEGIKIATAKKWWRKREGFPAKVFWCVNPLDVENENNYISHLNEIFLERQSWPFQVFFLDRTFTHGARKKEETQFSSEKEKGRKLTATGGEGGE